MPEQETNLSKANERETGQFTFIDIDRTDPNLKFRVPISIFDKKTPLPHVIYQNGEHLPHPQLAAEIMAAINK